MDEDQEKTLHTLYRAMTDAVVSLTVEARMERRVSIRKMREGGRMPEIDKTSDEHKFRQAMMAEKEWMEAHEPSVRYSQSSARDDWKSGKGTEHVALPTFMDCSSYYTYLVWRGMWETYGEERGYLDPSGYNWNQVGNSTSIANHARATKRTVPLLDVKKGDGAVWSGRHVAVMAQRPAKDPKGPDEHIGTAALVSSHGAESGPYKLTLQASAAYQGVMPIFCLAWIPKP